MNRSILTVTALLLLSGCASAPSAYHGKDYASEPTVRLNVSAVLVDTEYQAPATAPNVDHTLQPTPEEALRTAITQHYPLLRAGKSHAAEIRFVIKEASVTESALPQPDSWLERTTSDKPETHYDGHVVVEASASGPGTHRAGFVRAEASRSLEVAHLSPAERDRQLDGMVAHMVDDVMTQLDEQINSNLGSFAYGSGTQDETVTPQPSGRWDRVMEWR